MQSVVIALQVVKPGRRFGNVWRRGSEPACGVPLPSVLLVSTLGDVTALPVWPAQITKRMLYATRPGQSDERPRWHCYGSERSRAGMLLFWLARRSMWPGERCGRPARPGWRALAEVATIMLQWLLFSAGIQNAGRPAGLPGDLPRTAGWCSGDQTEDQKIHPRHAVVFRRRRQIWHVRMVVVARHDNGAK